MPNPRFEDHEEHIARIVRAALAACDPAASMRRALELRKSRFRRPGVVAMGKAAAGMYRGWSEVAGAADQALLVVPAGSPQSPPGHTLTGDHPIPGDASVAAAIALREFVARCKASADGLVLLISGGASAMVALPHASIPIGEYARITAELLRSGADIHELNTVRKHAELLKGGRLAAMAAPLPVDAYLISDVPGDDVSVVASGPVSADASTYADAMEVLSRRGVRSDATERLFVDGAAGLVSETSKAGDPAFANVRTTIVASNRVARHAAAVELARLGFGPVEQAGDLRGEAATMGIAIARAAMAAPAGWAGVWGGETTVRLGEARAKVGEGGEGGRNQELALAAALALDGEPGAVIASFGTDGVDGMTDAAGAWVTGGTAQEARKNGVDAAAMLAAHNSGGFFKRISGRLSTGKTGTNVSDLAVALRYP